MGFEGPDCLFCLVAAMHIRWDLLVHAFPFVDDAVDGPGACFIVKYLCVNCNVPCLEPFHDDVVDRDAMMISFCLEGLDKDSICSVVVCKNDVLVSTHGSNGKSGCVVGEQCCSGDYTYLQLVGGCCDEVEECHGWVDVVFKGWVVWLA